MSNVRVILNIDNDIMPHVGRQTDRGVIEAIGGVPHGMKSGATSVAFSIKLDNGNYVFAEISLKMLQMATAALSGKYGNETDDPTILGWIDD